MIGWTFGGWREEGVMVVEIGLKRRNMGWWRWRQGGWKETWWDDDHDSKGEELERTKSDGDALDGERVGGGVGDLL